MLSDNCLYILRRVHPMPNYEAGEYGSADASAVFDTYIEKIDLRTKEKTVLYSRVNEFTDLFLIGMTKDYVLMTEYHQDEAERHYLRLSLEDGYTEDVSVCSANDSCILPDDHSVIYVEREAGKTFFYRKDIDRQITEKIGELAGNYIIPSLFESYQSRLAELGFISIRSLDGSTSVHQLFYDWKADCVRKTSDGYQLIEKVYNDEQIAFQYGERSTHGDEWELILCPTGEAYAAVSSLLEEAG